MKYQFKNHISAPISSQQPPPSSFSPQLPPPSPSPPLIPTIPPLLPLPLPPSAPQRGSSSSRRQRRSSSPRHIPPIIRSSSPHHTPPLIRSTPSPPITRQSSLLQLHRPKKSKKKIASAKSIQIKSTSLSLSPPSLFLFSSFFIISIHTANSTPVQTVPSRRLSYPDNSVSNPSSGS